MAAFWQRAHEGYLMVDHRASPGLPEDMARRAGYDPALCGEGKMFEAATMGCAHCGVCVVKNPFRQRPRHSCAKCEHRYVCDYCAEWMTHPDYVHYSIEQITDIMHTGRWALAGTMTRPILTPASTLTIPA